MTEKPWLAAEAGDTAKRHAPSTLRNRDVIADVLADWLPPAGTILEVASGSGEHIIHFASLFPALHWQPSDPDAAALVSIAAWSAESGLANINAPVELDAAASDWPIAKATAIICTNMIHISPWEATLGLLAGAARLLPSGGPLILYGPYIEPDVVTSDSNMAFDQSLRARNPAWGLRETPRVIAAAVDAGLTFVERRAMPSNNLMLLFRRD
jgi:hypothetical protein